LIGSLLEVFKSIELVSIILRFVRPEDYGIISSPVERVLDSRRESNRVATYLAYLKDLRKVASNYGFRRAADADVALLMLHEKCFGSEPDHRIRREYEDDFVMRRIRAANLLARITNDWTD